MGIFSRVAAAAFGLSLGLSLCCTAQVPHIDPAEGSVRADHLLHIDALVEEALADKRMPGCVVTIGRAGDLAGGGSHGWAGGIVFQKAYGHKRLEPAPEPMTVDTLFDMASITKPVATATSIMILHERGLLRLRGKVAHHIPELANNGKEEITVLHCLTHQAGFIPDNALADYQAGREQAYANIHSLTLTCEPASRFIYSDVGFILLGELVERLSGRRLDDFARENIFEPLGMRETGFLPAESLQARAAPTEQRDGEWMVGQVHDPRAHLMDGVAGHAGLFSTADDMAIYATMMLRGGEYNGARILAPATVDLMTRAEQIVETDTASGKQRTTLRALGWDKASRYSANKGEHLSDSAFGHGGFTGTVLWIDPELDLYVIFLSNRVHPDGVGSVNELAGRICNVAAAALERTPQLRPAPRLVPSGQGVPAAIKGAAAVRTGLDNLIASGFEQLKGKRIGVITNHTGVDATGRHIIDLLHEAPDVNLVAIFSPEHGIAGALDEKVGDSRHEPTGLPIHSLYGDSRKPTPEQLADVDALVFDIQDIGCRFYTYISTMGLAMQAAAENGKGFIVLDRPNPINGVDVAGPILDDGAQSFVGFHTIPLRHGMTVGELARLFADEFNLPSDTLTVVPIEGWQRERFYDETGLLWINPSPNMRNLDQALLYPGVGLLETTNLSVGRGTDTPFQLFGAPWIDPVRLAAALNSAPAEHIAGLRFTPRHFTPDSSKFAGERCGGVQISITDRKAVRPITAGLEIARTLRALYPDDWELDRYNRLLASEATLHAIQNGAPTGEILRSFQPGLKAFRARREKALLY